MGVKKKQKTNTKTHLKLDQHFQYLSSLVVIEIQMYMQSSFLFSHVLSKDDIIKTSSTSS